MFGQPPRILLLAQALWDFCNIVGDCAKLAAFLLCQALPTRLAIIVIVSAIFASKVEAATQSDVTKAIAYVERVVEKHVVILAEDDTAYYVRIQERNVPTCGTHLNMNVSRLSIVDPSTGYVAEADSITSIHLTMFVDEERVILMDLNADGTLDQVVPDSAGTRESMQPEFDRIIRCIASRP